MTRRVDEIADAILDGTPVDWDAVDSGDLPPDPALVEQLRTLAALRGASHREGALAPPSSWSWGHLRVLERIGQGSSGDVFRAWDPRLDREVALKLFASNPEHHSTSEVVEEGRLLARVEHPNVVTIHGAATIDGRVGLWMELVRGRTLEEAIRDGRTFTAADVARIGIDLCSAVAAVHAAGLLHRDIKSHNVMLDDRGRVVLMDFGTGRDLEGPVEPQAAGTPLYLAPEVLVGSAATTRSDVYSVGVVLYRLATGSYPVYGSDLADLRRAHAITGSGDLGLSRAHVPARLRRVIGRAIDADPARRYPEAAALGAALAKASHAPAVGRIAAVAVAVAAVLTVVAIAGRSPGARDSAASAAAPVAAATPAIVVLPFQNVGSEPGSDEFVDGLTIEVIRNLQAIDGLETRSQTSSFYFKDRARDLRDVAAKLNVGLVVEARVQRSADRLRITAQLVSAPDDVPLWSERFEGRLDDVFTFQDEISRAIVNRLRLGFGRQQSRYQTSVEAYDLYLRGRVLVDRAGTEDSREAARLFEQVIVMDPTYAPAHAGLSEAYSGMSWQQTGLSSAEGLAGMRPAALNALALDPTLAEAHAAMGLVHARELDWDLSRQAFERALESPGALSEIRATYAIATLLPLGEAAEAERMLAAALTADPLSLSLRRDLATAQLLGGRAAEAVDNLQRVIDTDPTVFAVGNLMARALTVSGRPEEAIALWESRRWADWERWLLPAYLATGRRSDFDRIADADIRQHDFPLRQALAYAARGDKDRAFEALNRAVESFPARTAFTIACPELALLRGDPRLDELRARLNLR